MSPGAARFALVLGLALAGGARAEDTFEVLLLGSNEVPGPGSDGGSAAAVVTVAGPSVRVSITPRGLGDWMTVHLHKGGAGVARSLVVDFSSSRIQEGSPSTFLGAISEERLDDLLANPGNHYLHVHTPAFPSGAARGQLRRRTAVGAAPPLPTAAAIAAGPSPPAVPPPDAEPLAAPAGKGGVASPLPPDQSIRFRPLPSMVYRDPDFRVEATASSGLPVSFTASGDCSVSGAVVHILSAGKCWLTAHQPGDPNFHAAPDVEQRLVIEKAGQRIGGAPPSTRTYLDPDFGLGLVASSGLPIVLQVWGDCTSDGSSVHIVAAGTCDFTAHQPGDPNYTAAPIVEGRIVIEKAGQTIEFGEFFSPYYGTSALPLVARASSGLPVGFAAAGPCAVLGAFLRILDSGRCTVTAFQSGDANFKAAPPVERAFDIVVPVAAEPGPAR